MEILHAFISLGLLGFIQSFLLHHDICEEIMYVDCKREALPGNRLYRDNNGNIYENFCTYTQAKCKDSSIDLETVCTCEHPTINTQVTLKPLTTQTTVQPMVKSTTHSTKASSTLINVTSGKSTTVPSSEPVSTQNTLVSAFCKNKDLVSCPSNVAVVCGSDNKSYNRCELAKAQCDNQNLSIAREGAC
ncbi:uncharacterized protein LOC127701520 [Mytilus californianus]|uniref:uncharacterized protein LOC127701520 n=1 Tax=Mytilus californianus TaxID=6549 RepID=UPI0022460F09|nr:uncharacterized protein LOC127701520 [Mytilus californianus]